MFYKKNLLLCLFLIVVVLLSSCSSLTSSENHSSSVIIGFGSDCSIVYSKSSSDYVVRQAKSLETQIENSFGSFVTLNSDWTVQTDDPDTVEILFGNTSRPESVRAYADLPENGYIIREENGKIVIAATSEKLLKLASVRFLSDFVSMNTGISFPKNTNIIKSDFSFFNIAFDGTSDVSIVIPDDSTPAVQKLASYAANQINKKCNTEIKVINQSNAQGISGAILVSSSDKLLTKNESCISFIDNRLDIKGANEFSTINALSLFIDHVVNSCDKKEDGNYHIYFSTDTVIQIEWDYSIPIFAGGSFEKAERISSNSYALHFSGALESDYRNYIDILKILGFTPVNSSEKEDICSCELNNTETNVAITFSRETGNVSIHLSGKTLNS